MLLNRRSLATGLLFVLCSSDSPAQSPPSLNIYAPPELAAAKRRVEAFDTRTLAGIVQTVGLEAPGPTIDVVLAGEDSDAARTSGLEIAGYAISRAGLVVLFPARSARYPHDTLEDVLRHEVAHVLISRAAGGRDVPRWFHEGLSVAVERPWDLEDRSRLVWQLLAGPRLTLRDIDALFAGGPATQARAYSLSAAVVRDLMGHYGAGVPANVLRRVREGAHFDEAVAAVAGRPLGAIEEDFWNRQRVWTIWVPLLTSGEVLWIFVILVATLAVWRRRRQSARLRRQWDDEARTSEVDPSAHDDDDDDDDKHRARE